jgi:type IV fimbrial biogenesis protein FimT
LLEVTMSRRRTTGFTLVELLIVMTILGIMMALGIPSFQNFIGSQRAKSVSSDLMTSLLMARSEAIKRNTDVTVTPLTANTWTSGWTVAAGATTIQTAAAIDNLTLTSPTSTPSVTFKGTGRPSAAAKWQITSSTTSRCVKLDSSGSPSASSGTCP